MEKWYVKFVSLETKEDFQDIQTKLQEEFQLVLEKHSIASRFKASLYKLVPSFYVKCNDVEPLKEFLKRNRFLPASKVNADAFTLLCDQ